MIIGYDIGENKVMMIYFESKYVLVYVLFIILVR